MFSNAINHSIAIRRVTVAGLGNAAKFTTTDQEYRFNCRFEVLSSPDLTERNRFSGARVPFLTARSCSFVVNDEKGASTPDGMFRVFAGLRSDPFYLPGSWRSLKKFPNLLQHDNVLSIVIEFDTRPRARTQRRVRCSG